MAAESGLCAALSRLAGGWAEVPQTLLYHYTYVADKLLYNEFPLRGDAAGYINAKHDFLDALQQEITPAERAFAVSTVQADVSAVGHVRLDTLLRIVRDINSNRPYDAQLAQYEILKHIQAIADETVPPAASDPATGADAASTNVCLPTAQCYEGPSA